MGLPPFDALELANISVNPAGESAVARWPAVTTAMARHEAARDMGTQALDRLR